MRRRENDRKREKFMIVNFFVCQLFFRIHFFSDSFPLVVNLLTNYFLLIVATGKEEETQKASTRHQAFQPWQVVIIISTCHHPLLSHSQPSLCFFSHPFPRLTSVQKIVNEPKDICFLFSGTASERPLLADSIHCQDDFDGTGLSFSVVHFRRKQSGCRWRMCAALRRIVPFFGLWQFGKLQGVCASKSVYRSARCFGCRKDSRFFARKDHNGL